MNLLRMLWPTPFKIQKGNVVSLVVQLVIFVVLCALVGWLIGLLASTPIVGVIFGIVGGLLELYGLIGIILCVLKFLGTV